MSPAHPPTHPTENCFMHHTEDEVNLEDRLDKACEPGVDYGESGGGGARMRGCV